MDSVSVGILQVGGGVQPFTVVAGTIVPPLQKSGPVGVYQGQETLLSVTVKLKRLLVPMAFLTETEYVPGDTNSIDILHKAPGGQ